MVKTTLTPETHYHLYDLLMNEKEYTLDILIKVKNSTIRISIATIMTVNKGIGGEGDASIMNGDYDCCCFLLGCLYELMTHYRSHCDSLMIDRCN